MEADTRDMKVGPPAAAEQAVQPHGSYLHRTFHSLRVRNFRLFVSGQLLSAVGTWMQWTAAPLLVLHLTGSGVAVGIDTALGFLPILLFGAWGGVFADRFDNRRILVATQFAFAAVSLVLWGLVATDVVTVWMVYAASFLSGMVNAVDMPTRQSFYLVMVGPDRLTNAMSLNTATFTGSRVIGPAIAAILIKTFGLAPVFLINAVSFLPVVVALMMMRRDELRSRPRAPRARGQIREGIRYVWSRPALRLPIVIMGVVFLFTFNYVVLLPLLAIRTFHGDAGTYGNLLAMFGVGSLAGALAMAGRASRPDIRLLAVLAMVFGVVAVASALAPTLPVALALMVPLGAAGLAFAVTANSTLQLASSDEMRGRVMALYTVVFLGSTPIGGPIAGVVGEHLGPRVGLAGGGVFAVAAGVAGLVALRRAVAAEGGRMARAASDGGSA
ncbi:MAG: MFS transporter [Actinomycetota bacterium]